MVRTQVQLTEEQAQVVKRLAAERGVSMAEILRRSVDEYVRRDHLPDRAELRRHALAIIGMIKGGPADIAERHDDYLAEAFDHEHLR